jgi:phosphohistidine swiveling domain-containing protein
MSKKEKFPKYFYNLRIVATRPETVQRDEFIGNIWTRGGKMRGASVPYKSGSRALCFEKNDTQKRYDAIIESIFKNYKAHLTDYNKAVAGIDSASKEVKKAVKLRLSGKQKIRAFKKWTDSLVDYAIPIIAPFAIEEILDEKCRSLLLKKYSKQEANKMFEIISMPTRINTYQKMRLEITNVALAKKADSSAYKKLVKKYGWYSEYTYAEPLLDMKHFIKEVKKLSRKKAQKEKSQILEINRNKKIFQKLRIEIKDKKIKFLAQVLNDYVYIRTERIEHLKKTQVRLRPLFHEIVEELGKLEPGKWNYDSVINFTNNEITDFLKKRKLPDKKEIQSRLSHDYIYYYEKGAHLIYSKNIIKKIQKLVDESMDQGRNIKGVVARAGVARGKVVIVHNKADLAKIKKGDILVARFTMPDYTKVMKVAGAYVTEEGGITSHAAIIARELKKPCIVNTGNCMRILKDGDLVEVNADEGIVKILK